MPSSLSADLVFDTAYPPQLQTRNNKNEGKLPLPVLGPCSPSLSLCTTALHTHASDTSLPAVCDGYHGGRQGVTVACPETRNRYSLNTQPCSLPRHVIRRHVACVAVSGTGPC